MVKEQNSPSQDVCLIQWIKTDYVHLRAVIQHCVFPLLLSDVPRHIYFTQYSLTFKTGLLKSSNVFYGFDTWF